MSTGDHVFCFDLDDTLFSESDYVESGLRAAGALVDGEAPGPEPAGAWLIALWRRERARDAFQQLLRARGFDEERWLARLKEAYRAHLPEIQPRAGVLDALGGLLHRGDHLALVTDGDLDVQRRKWAALRLPFPFAPVVFTDVKGRPYWKPNPWGFERVMEAYPSAARFFYVGDNPAKDFIAPNRLGWTTVMVRDDRNLHSPSFGPGEAAPRLSLDGFAGLIDLR